MLETVKTLITAEPAHLNLLLIGAMVRAGQEFPEYKVCIELRERMIDHLYEWARERDIQVRWRKEMARRTAGKHYLVETVAPGHDQILLELDAEIARYIADAITLEAA